MVTDYFCSTIQINHSLLVTHLASARAECPRTGTCAWPPRRCSLLDPGRTAAPWLFGCPAASEWASQGSALQRKEVKKTVNTTWMDLSLRDRAVDIIGPKNAAKKTQPRACATFISLSNKKCLMGEVGHIWPFTLYQIITTHKTPCPQLKISTWPCQTLLLWCRFTFI